MDATKAREKTIEFIEKQAMPFDLVVKKIEEAIEQGKFYIFIDNLSQEAERSLKTKGYEVKEFSASKRISWK